MPKTKTNNMLTAMLATFCTMATSMGKRVFCIPMSHPVTLNMPSMAGAPQMRMPKYTDASVATCGDGCINHKAPSSTSRWNKLKHNATANDMPLERSNKATTSVRSLRPKACDVRPLVPMRKKPNTQ